MRKQLLTITLLMMLALVSYAIAQMAPYSVDHTYASTNAAGATAVGSFIFDRAVQPTALHVYGVLPNTQTTTVSRVHGNLVQVLADITVAAGVGSATLSNGVWLVPGDVLKVSGPTNATIEVQGVAW